MKMAAHGAIDVDGFLRSFCALCEGLIACIVDAEQQQDLFSQSDAYSNMSQLLECGTNFEAFVPAYLHRGWGDSYGDCGIEQ